MPHADPTATPTITVPPPTRTGKPVNRFALAGFFTLIGIALLSYLIADIGYTRQLAITPDYGPFEDWVYRNWYGVLLGDPLLIPGVIASIVFAHIALTKTRRHLWGKTFAIITLIIGYLTVLGGTLGVAVLLLLVASLSNLVP